MSICPSPVPRQTTSLRVAVLVDSGIRSGTDVLKCLALGARAVLIGRPVLYGLTCGGEEGVEHVLNMFKKELTYDMSCVGCDTIEQINRHILYRPPLTATTPKE